MNTADSTNRHIKYTLSDFITACKQRYLPSVVPEANNIPVGKRVKIRSGRAVQLDSFDMSCSSCFFSCEHCFTCPFTFGYIDPLSPANIDDSFVTDATSSLGIRNFGRPKLQTYIKAYSRDDKAKAFNCGILRGRSSPGEKEEGSARSGT